MCIHKQKCYTDLELRGMLQDEYRKHSYSGTIFGMETAALKVLRSLTPMPPKPRNGKEMG